MTAITLVNALHNTSFNGGTVTDTTPKDSTLKEQDKEENK
jgi:hypothetical protein